MPVSTAFDLGAHHQEQRAPAAPVFLVERHLQLQLSLRVRLGGRQQMFVAVDARQRKADALALPDEFDAVMVSGPTVGEAFGAVRVQQLFEMPATALHRD